MDKNNKPKLLSLFDGSGGFPLAGLLCGIEPVAASEVEPYPIAVTRTHIPDMKHLGDVSLINGGEIAPVDIITFGSPCQDMSVAGKRDGLDGSRSNLFYEAIRIIKEMRKATNGLYPRFAVWENVPGAFSSNNGRDFHSVLEAFVQVCEPSATVPEMPKGGWPYADIIMGDGWSIAYRTYDAQYWGVPQRRRRIYLVADFGGQCAGQISFERKGLRGHSSQSGTERQGIAADAENGTDTADGKACVAAAFCPEESAKTRGVGYEVELAPTLRAGAVPACIAIDNHPADSRVSISEDGNVQTLTGRMGTGGGNTPMVLCLQGNGIDRADTANCNGKGWKENCCYTLNTIDRPAVAYSFDSIASNSMKSKNPHSGCRQVDVAKTLDTTYPDPSKNQGGVAIVCTQKAYDQYEQDEIASTLKAQGGSYGGGSENIVVELQYTVRRLTPTECARLQGFPDCWGEIQHSDELTDEEYDFWLGVRTTYDAINGKPEKKYTKEQILTWYNKLHSNSSEYKMWGNGIALPCALYVMEGIAEVLNNSNENAEESD